jgi:hypothetical protein
MIPLVLVVGGMFGLMGTTVPGSISPPPSYNAITTQAGVNITTQGGAPLKTDSP